jgi:hypothetical protein
MAKENVSFLDFDGAYLQTTVDRENVATRHCDANSGAKKMRMLTHTVLVMLFSEKCYL